MSLYILWLVHLRNNTDEHVTFMLKDKNLYSIKLLSCEPLYGIVPSRSSYTLIVSTTKEELAKRRETDLDLILKTSTSGDRYAVLFMARLECRNLFREAREMGNGVHKVAVLRKADYNVPQLEETKSKPAVTPSTIKIISMKNTDKKLCSLDVHPTERWIITGHSHGYVCTWNQETQGLTDTVRVSEKSVTSVKVIARKQWIVAMASDGCICVYSCARVTKMQKITSFRADSSFTKSLAVHPTLPYVLSMSGELWDMDKGWERRFFFYNGSGYQVAFNPKDSNSFACASEEVVKVWSSLDSCNSDYTLSGHLKTVNCLHFFTRDDEQYLITGSEDNTAKIWDWQERKCIHTMEAIMSPVTCVVSLPDRPYLVTGSEHGTVQLWSSTDFRLLGTINVGGGGPVRGLACLMGSPRVVIGQKHAITIMEIDHEESVASEGNN